MSPAQFLPLFLAIVVSAWWVSWKMVSKSRKGERITAGIAGLPVALIAAAVAWPMIAGAA